MPFRRTNMSVNSSSNAFLDTTFEDCFYHETTIIFTCVFVISILLLPLFILVLYVGYQRWKSQRSSSPNGISSHMDVITYNMVVMELMSVLATCLYCYGIYVKEIDFISAGMFLYSIVTPGMTLFHVLTCVERYLAVVHPVTYLGLRQASGARIRNITIGCVWLLCFAVMGLVMFTRLIIINSFILGLSTVVVSICSLAVLWVLIRPGPGEVGGNRERIDQSKKRAFHTMMAIMAALSLRFFATLSTSLIQIAPLGDSDCLIMFSLILFQVPSSLVLPVLFLQKVGKLPCCKQMPDG